MFSQRYRKACDALKMDEKKIEEMIEMTEKKGAVGSRRPRRAALAVAVLAATVLVAAVGLTAGAAELPAVRQIIYTVFLRKEEGGEIKTEVVPAEVVTVDGAIEWTPTGEGGELTPGENERSGFITYDYSGTVPEGAGDVAFSITLPDEPDAEGTYSIGRVTLK